MTSPARLFLGVIFLAVLSQLPHACQASVVAKVGDREITLAEVEAASRGKISTLSREVVAVKQAALKLLIKNLLLDLAAGKAGLSRAEFYEREVTAKARVVTQDEVDEFYRKHRDDFSGDATEDKRAVRFYLERRTREDREKRLLAELAQRFGVSRHAVDEARLTGTGDFELARVAGKPVTNRMVEEAAKLKLYRLRGERTREILRQIDQLVYQALLSLAARQRGVSPAELQAKLRQERGQVTDEEIERYYREEVLAKDAHAVKHPERIRPYLEFLAVKRAEDDLVSEMRGRIPVDILVHQPLPVRLTVKEVSWSPSKGGAQAPVRLVAFYNYRCRYCREMLGIYGKLADEFKDKVRLSLRHFVPHYDPRADTLAREAVCANKQGRFWQWHRAVLESGDLPRRWEPLARKVALSLKEFGDCLASKETARLVEADSAVAKSLGLDEAPVLLVNGRVLGGRQGIERLRRAVIEELAAGGARAK